MVVSNHREVGKLEIVHILRIPLFNLLLDEGVYHGVGFSAARSTQYDGRTKRIYHVNPTVVPLLPVIETGGQVDGILVFKQACFLHERFVLLIEHIVHEVVFQQAAHVKP